MLLPAWSRAPLFCSVKGRQWERLTAIAGSRSLDPRETLFLEEAPCTGFYVLEEGAIQLTRSADDPGAHPTLAVVTPVSSFAEAALFGGEAFPATATALKPSRVVHFPKATFLGVMREDPDLALAILHAQSVWLRKLTRQVEQLTASDSAQRLAAWIQENIAPGGTLVLPVTKKALAAQLGMTPETLSRNLRTLQAQGRVRVKGTAFSRP